MLPVALGNSPFALREKKSSKVRDGFFQDGSDSTGGEFPPSFSWIFFFSEVLIEKNTMVYYRSIPSRELTYPPKMACLKMIFLFPRWDMLIPWRVLYMFITLDIHFCGEFGEVPEESTAGQRIEGLGSIM